MITLSTILMQSMMGQTEKQRVQPVQASALTVGMCVSASNSIACITFHYQISNLLTNYDISTKYKNNYLVSCVVARHVALAAVDAHLGVDEGYNVLPVIKVQRLSDTLSH